MAAKKMEKLVIKRKKWLRGEGGADSFLRRADDGKMCCLGFLARQRGASIKQITDIGSPCELYNRKNIRLKGLMRNTDQHTITGNNLMATNDDDYDTTEDQREAELTKLFRRIGVAVKFVG